ncbi:MAG: hypothetical protein ACLU7D_11715 [Collinsella sp.]
MFRDRLLSSGKSATCYSSTEAQVRTALASDSINVAIVVSCYGLLTSRNAGPQRRHVSASSLSHLIVPPARHAPTSTVAAQPERDTRITGLQAISPMQYVVALDSSYSSYFTEDYARCATRF